MISFDSRFRACLALLLLQGGLLAGFAQQPVPAPLSADKLSVLTDRADATYHVRDQVIFTITLSHDGTPVAGGNVSWSLSKDGFGSLQQGIAAVKDGSATVTGRLLEPGFLQCKAAFKTGEGNITGLGAAAVDPLEIHASLPPPDDFDAFWAAQKDRLRKIPLNAKMTPVPKSKPGIDLFDVQADAVGNQPMRGFYARPAGARPGSLPAIITLEGAGVYGTRLEPWLMGWAKDGFLSLELNAHGLPNNQPAEYYLGLEKGALKDYPFMGRTSRDTFYFLNMYLRDLRGLDFLTSQPEWDGRVLIASGASQGAAQAIFLAAEDSRVTFLAAVVPAMCDHSGMVVGRIAGWPKLVPTAADGKPDPAVLQTSRYFDSMNFATRLRIPAFFVAGFIDQVAPPTSVYAAYNNITSEKEIYPAVLSPHKVGPEVWEEFRRRILLRK